MQLEDFNGLLIKASETTNCYVSRPRKKGWFYFPSLINVMLEQLVINTVVIQIHNDTLN